MNHINFTDQFRELIELLESWGYSSNEVMSMRADADGIEIEIRGDSRSERQTHLIPREGH